MLSLFTTEQGSKMVLSDAIGVSDCNLFRIASIFVMKKITKVIRQLFVGYALRQGTTSRVTHEMLCDFVDGFLVSSTPVDLIRVVIGLRFSQ